ncbi:MAG: hypothetical protein MJ131_05320 [Lachnospiraceae bacterium]|nr:hypothetical protein [Lachnospiraceae bacterium]
MGDSEEYICTLDADINRCTKLLADREHCEGYMTCAFFQKEVRCAEHAPTKPYVRTARWYEVYYSKRRA